jgi:hypothetical protein
METLKLLTAATLLAGPTAENKGLIFSDCAPRAIALEATQAHGL